jgi:hypothetical protein
MFDYLRVTPSHTVLMVMDNQFPYNRSLAYLESIHTISVDFVYVLAIMIHYSIVYQS